MRMNLDVDVCGAPVPTFVSPHGVGQGSTFGALATSPSTLRGARLVELPGLQLRWATRKRSSAEIERFFADLQSSEWEPAEPDRMLATVLFTDIVGSTQQAAKLGDRGWRDLLTGTKRGPARASRIRGNEIDTAGDGFFATFDGPAVRSARAGRLRRARARIELRAGLHTGECEVGDEARRPGGQHRGSHRWRRRPGEVLVSSTVKELVVGSGHEFRIADAHELRASRARGASMPSSASWLLRLGLRPKAASGRRVPSRIRKRRRRLHTPRPWSVVPRECGSSTPAV